MIARISLTRRGSISGSGTQNPFEVDFTFWYQRKRMFDLQEEPVLVFGEGKSFATESFKPEDVARMRKLAEKFPGAFHVFAALKADLTDVEKRAIGEFATWGRNAWPMGDRVLP